METIIQSYNWGNLKHTNFSNNKNVSSSITTTKPEVLPAGKLALRDIPSEAFANRIQLSFNGINKFMPLKPEEVNRAVIVNDQDFLALNQNSIRTISGVIPNKPLQTADIIITDTKIPPVIPTKRGDLIFPVNSLEFDQVNALVHAKETQEMLDNFWGMKVNWAFDGPIKVNAHDRYFNPGTGEYSETWDNAYYSRVDKVISLLIGENKREKGFVYSSRCADTIAHETAHAKLDGLDKYFSDTKFFIGAGIHEAFADFNAILHALYSDKVMDRLLEKTGGDLRKHNMVSMFSEEFAQKVLAKPREALRDAVNDFVHPDSFEEMSFIPPDRNTLGIECHSYSQVLTGALYDIMVDIYKSNQKVSGFTNKTALVKTREIMGSIFNRSLLYLHPGETSFKDIAMAMIKVDQVEFDGKNSEIIKNCFLKRNIVKDIDIKNFEEQQAKVLQVSLPQNIKKSEDFNEFLNKHKVDLGINNDTNYKFESCLVDNKGNKFVKYANNFKIKLPDDRKVYYDNAKASMPVKDGLTLAFDNQGNLKSCMVKEIKDTDQKELLNIMAKFCEFRYKALYDGYDEIEKEIEELKRKREEERKRKAEEKNKEIQGVNPNSINISCNKVSTSGFDFPEDGDMKLKKYYLGLEKIMYLSNIIDAIEKRYQTPGLIF